MAEVKDYSEEVDRLIERQLRDWDTVRSNYDALSRVHTRQLTIGDNATIVLQFNPERIRSSAAKVDAASLKARKCFLCTENQPAEQERIEWGEGRYKIQVNPYPIFPRHLTIAAMRHTPQSMLDLTRYTDMLALARALPRFVTFYNGPKCGASAPDHMHFQAGNKGFMPLCDEVLDPGLWIDNRVEMHEDDFIGFNLTLGRPFFMIQTASSTLAGIWFGRLQMAMVKASGRAEEPMQNILTWWDADEGLYRTIVFPRRKHRPSNYGEGKGQFLLSPASVDMGGVWAVPVEKDYLALTATDVQQMLNELCADTREMTHIIDNFLML